MFCPYCNVEYENHEPCFCHPAPLSLAAHEVEKPKVAEERLPPTGLDNPFWKPEVELPPAIASTPAPRPGRSGLSV